MRVSVQGALVAALVPISTIALVVTLHADESENDLESYISGIRRSGMSEMARLHLQTLASISSGNTAISIRRGASGSGAYGIWYESTYCPAPRADSTVVRKEQERRQALTDRDLKVWRRIADLDTSGFVTTSEALATRSLAEFGYKAGFIIKSDGRRVGDIARGIAEPESLVNKKLKQYDLFLKRVRVLGLRTETLPEINLEKSDSVRTKPRRLGALREKRPQFERIASCTLDPPGSELRTTLSILAATLSARAAGPPVS